MYGIELAYLAGKKYAKARSDLFKKFPLLHLWRTSRKLWYRLS